MNEEESSESSEYESFIKSEDSGESSDVSLDPMPIIDELDAPDRKLVELTQKNRELKAKKQLVKTPKTPRRLAIHDSSSESDREEDIPSDEQSSSASQSERTDESDVESTAPEKKKRRPGKPLPLDYTIFGWNLPLTSWFPVVLQLIASEWMEPGFIESAIEQQDEYFMPPWLKMIDILQRKKDTLVSSQLWSSEFKVCFDIGFVLNDSCSVIRKIYNVIHAFNSRILYRSLGVKHVAVQIEFPLTLLYYPKNVICVFTRYETHNI